jgi:predicted SnoaL-like aldol condensation-catalyzing enzyme
MRIFPAIRMLLALLALAGSSFVLCPAYAADPPVDTLKANKAAVYGFYDLAFNGRDPQAAVDQLAGDGAAAFVAFVTAFTQANPDLRVEFKRFIAEGELVVVHCNIKLTEEDRGSAVMDIFRLKDGKVVEHWDVIQPVPETAANDNTMF